MKTRQLLVLVLALVPVGCGDDGQVTDSNSSTTNASSTSGDSTGTSESGAESGTETGEPGNLCSTCAEDEMCLAVAYDACGEDFGYDLSCIPAIPACADNKCDPECLQAACGNTFCTPPCGFDLGVDVWCAAGFPSSCDPLAQDCPEGEKCVPRSATGDGNLDDTKCVSITGDGAPGEACTYGGVVEATDDCDGDSMCFGVGDDSMGTCYAFCGPDYACGPGQGCFVANDGVINVCLDSCVPHHPEGCAAGEVCIAVDEELLCMPSVPTLDPGAACMPGQTCAPGQICTSAAELDGCADMSCCTDLCDTGEPDPCTPPLTCQAVYQQGQAPAGLETMGSCRVP